MPFIPAKTVTHGGGTLKAVLYFFTDGLTVIEAAKKAGITKQAANAPIQRTKREVLKAGYRLHSNWIARDECIKVVKKVKEG